MIGSPVPPPIPPAVTQRRISWHSLLDRPQSLIDAAARGAPVPDAAPSTALPAAYATTDPVVSAEYADLVDTVNALRADLDAVRSTINTFLARARAQGWIK